MSDERHTHHLRRREANAHGKICGKCGRDLKRGEVATKEMLTTEDQGPLFPGRFMTEIELQCSDCCTGQEKWTRWEKVDCHWCQRAFYQLIKRGRRFDYCCTDCRDALRKHVAKVELSLIHI